ncbi:MAG: hypothetical protein Q8P41_28505 [Pseudomonadota bacterium]|nr:hypothetical protein [Pseudomonadota bacterium]
MRCLSWFVLPVALLAACGDPDEKDTLRGTTDAADDTGDTDGDTGDTTDDTALVPFIDHCGVIEADETWRAADAHRITCNVKVLQGTLTIEAGVGMEVSEGDGIEVGDGDLAASLLVLGTADDPVVLRPVQDAGEDTRWAGITLGPNTATAQLSYLELYDSGDAEAGSLHVEGAEVAVDGLIIDNAENCGIKLIEGGRLAEGARGLVITNSGGAAACVGVSQVHTLPAEDSAYTGNTYDQVNVSGSALRASVTWDDLGVPYAITDSFEVSYTADEPAILTIDPGVVVKMAEGTEINFSSDGGASGLQADSVTFTALGAMVAGSWRGISFERGTEDGTRLSDVTIEYAGGDAQAAALLLSDAWVILDDVTVSDSATVAIRLQGWTQLLHGSGGITATGSALPLSAVPNAVGSLPDDIDLAGNDEDVILLSGDGLVYASANWGAFDWDYRVATNIAVDGSADYPAVLTLSPGVTLRFDNDARLEVGKDGAAGLIAQGTSTSRVRFIPYDAYQPGAWGGIAFYGNTEDAFAILDNFEVGWAGGERLGAGVVVTEGALPTISNGYIHDSTEWGLLGDCSSVVPTSMTYADNFSGDESITPCG